jgi:hypothetical protein
MLRNRKQNITHKEEIMKKIILASLMAVLAAGAHGKSAPFQASLTPNVALQKRDTVIEGISIGVWNENPGTQWQLGFVNGATGNSAGLQWFLFLPTLLNYAEDYTGAQIGFINYASGDYTGLQWGLVNYANHLTGLQWGTVNVAQAVDGGFQWGVVNYAESARNLLQIGLVNIISDNEWFSHLPNELAQGFVLVNWTFGDN